MAFLDEILRVLGELTERLARLRTERENLYKALDKNYKRFGTIQKPAKAWAAWLEARRNVEGGDYTGYEQDLLDALHKAELIP